MNRFLLKIVAKIIRYKKRKYGVITFRCSTDEFRWVASNKGIRMECTVFSDDKLFAVIMSAKQIKSRNLHMIAEVKNELNQR